MTSPSPCRNAFRRPGFTLLVVLTLALGIGVNSAVFALLDGVLLRPLPYRDPSRLVFVWQTLPSKNVMELEATPVRLRGLAWASRRLRSSAMAKPDTFTLTGDDNPERVRGSRVTASLMPLLGIAPRIGRPFTPAEDLDGTAPVAILSDGLWRRRFGADPQSLGRTIQINGESRTIVGVMPRGASLPGPLAERRRPLAAGADVAGRAHQRGQPQLSLPRPAAPTASTLEQASAELDAFAARMAAERPLAPVDRGEAGSDRRANGPRHPADAAADRRQRRAAAARRQRQRLDAAARARVQPAARAGGAHRARCDPRPTPLAGGRRVARVRLSRRARRAVPRRLGAARGAAAVCRLAARGHSDRHRRARGASSRRPSPPSSDCRSASSSRSIGRTAGSSTC